MPACPSEPNRRLLAHVISAIPPPTSLWRISGFLQERGDEPWYKQMAYSHKFLLILWQTCSKVRLARGFTCSLYFQIHQDPRKDECLSNIREFVKGCALYHIEVSAAWALSFCSVQLICMLVHISDHWFSGLFVWCEGKPGLSWSWEQTNPVCFGFGVIITLVTMALSVIVASWLVLPWQFLKWFMQYCFNIVHAVSQL